MAGSARTRLSKWKENHKQLWQFVSYALVGLFISATEFVSFIILNFVVFIRFSDRPFSWWLFDYAVEDGGLKSFLSYAVTFAISQTINFIVQRKKTFKANNNVAKSAAMYVVMVIVLYCMQVYLPTVIRTPIARVFGEALGDILALAASMFCAMLIQFPLSKWVIMRRV